MSVALCSLLLAGASASVELEPLRPLEPYVGHCWTARMSPDTTDRHCFSAVYQGKHVRDQHVVTSKGQRGYEGESIYSSDGGRVVFIYFNSLGGVGQGTAEASNGGLSFDLSMRAWPGAEPQVFHTVWRRTADGYETVTGGEVRRFRLDD